jgi:hypothetical protein
MYQLLCESWHSEWEGLIRLKPIDVPQAGLHSEPMV